MPDDSDVPAYEPMLAAYHRAFAAELRTMVATLPIEPGQVVLDMACGDGVYAPWLAERVGPEGRVIAVDLVPAYLDLARREAAKSAFAEIIEFAAAPIESLPFEDGTFDLCWCAQSLYSLPDPVEALRQMLRVTRPGGVVAVQESDTLHHVILPWPIEVELAARAAELEELARREEKPRKFYVGRQLRKVFRDAGLVEFEQRSFAIDRMGPFKADERAFFAEYLKSLAKYSSKHLAGAIREEFDRLVDPESGSYLLDDPDATATCIDHLAWGRKPRVPGKR